MFKKKKKNATVDMNDRRVGHFTFHVEDEHIKIYDDSDLMSIRISRFVAAGQIIEMALRTGESDNMLENIALIYFQALLTVPDGDYLVAVSKASTECMERNKAIYGMKNDLERDEEKIAMEFLKENSTMESALNL